MGLDALLSGLESFGSAALNLYDVQATKIRQLANDQITLIVQQIQDIQREGVLQSRVHARSACTTFKRFAIWAFRVQMVQ